MTVCRSALVLLSLVIALVAAAPANAAAFPTSAARRRALPAFLARYNTTRPHKSLGGIPPAQRLADRNNPATAYS